ncbi:MAG: hypothetical protein K1X35_06565 [Caulobacteraceae bacterium]|nr:hypothetical protein [Caulobacteraceae bacterium]
MHRAALFALALALALPAKAAPLPLAVVTVEGPGVPFGTSERIDSLVSRLSDEGLIDARPARLAVKRLKACGRSLDRIRCVRAQLRTRPPLELPLHVAVIAIPGPGDQVRLTCVGPRRRFRADPEAEAYVDLAAALSDSPASATWRARLARCLDRAAGERRL